MQNLDDQILLTRQELVNLYGSAKSQVAQLEQLLLRETLTSLEQRVKAPLHRP